MSKSYYFFTKIIIVVVLLLCITGIGYSKYQSQQNVETLKDPLENLEPIPTLIEFGSLTCIPCQQMKPIIKALSEEYAGELQVIFVDVEIYTKIAEKYKIEIRPTQVFLDNLGQEIFRHEGFFPKEDILAQWKELGFEFEKTGTLEKSDDTSNKYIGEFFKSLNHALTGTPLIALLASLIWGILSILLSPCHLSSIPLVIAFLGQQGKIDTKKAFIFSTIFSLGILITIILVGILTGLAGRMLGDIGPFGSYIVAILFFIVGLYLLDIIILPWNMPNLMNTATKGKTGALLLGLVFGIAVGPCTFAYMAPMLGIAFKVASQNLGYAILLLLIYGVGHCGVIAIAGTSAHKVQSYLDWTEKSSGTIIAKRICGMFLLIAGLYLIFIA